jgi:hypothetical protein
VETVRLKWHAIHPHRRRTGKRGGVEGDKLIVDKPKNLSKEVKHGKPKMAMYVVWVSINHR